ncbi:MAG: dihydroorotate dehydrogenase electron transfer subunit [Candidatus Thorarchaeota archaeon]
MFIQKIKKGWQELYEEVIQTGKCVYCGACGAFCANIKFDREKEVPIEDGSCKDMNTCRDGYGLCYNLCPKTEIDLIPISLLDKWVFGIRSERILGHYIDIKSVKLTEKALGKFPSNAGPLTALLYVAMENGLIDASIITDKDGDFKPFPIIAESPKDLLKGVGYKPSQSPTISLVGEAINKEHSDIAVVGTPCQIQALRKLQTHPTFDYEAYDLVTLAIGTFCTGTYYNKILSEIFLKNGIKDSEIEQIDTDKNNFTLKVRTNSEVKEIPLNYLYENAIRKACFSCSDYTASFADISVGNFGSEIGWDTVIIRTERGKQIFDLAIEQGIIITKPLDKDNEELILDITRSKTDIVKIESIIEHSPKIKSFIIRNQRIAKAYKPGMFVILWLPDIDFLPMSISKIDGNLIEITVERIGEGTSKLFDLVQGDLIGIRGPYGNTWNYEDAENILIVGGGMGIAALTSLIEPLKKNKKNVFIAIGAKDEPSLIFSDRLIDLIPNTLCTTDDGSVGKKCFVTDTIEDIIKKEKIDLILTCGPEVMMKQVLEIANSNNIEIQASLERKMKCGVGLCGSCCIGEKNNITVCKEGPIFNSTQLKSFPQFGKYSKE